MRDILPLIGAGGEFLVVQCYSQAEAILDTGPLGLLIKPKKLPKTRATTRWALDMMMTGYRLVVPAITDYEVRRKLEHAERRQGLAQLDAFNAAHERLRAECRPHV